MFKTSASLRLLAAGVLAASARTQTITTIIQTGDNVAGIGNVGLVQGMAVDDLGNVLVHVLTDNPNQDTNGAMVGVGGAPVVFEGQAVSQPSGAVIQSFNGGEVSLSSHGSSAFLIRLLGAPGNPDDNYIYYNVPLALGLREGDACTAPELTNGSIFRIFLPPLINDTNQLCFHGVVDDPNVPGTYDVSALFQVDTSTGVQTARYKEGDILPGQTWGIWEFNWDSGGLAFNSSGQVFFGASTFAAAGTNLVLYLDDTKIAQTGEVSPFGSSYISLGTSVLGQDLNSQGQYAFSCRLNDGTDGIVVEGHRFVQTGDSLPAIEPFQLSEIGQPLLFGEDERVLWYGLWNLPGGSQARGIFADYTLLVEEGATRINGFLVQQITGLDRSFTMSPSGQYVIFEATLETVGEGAYLIDLWQ